MRVDDAAARARHVAAQPQEPAGPPRGRPAESAARRDAGEHERGAVDALARLQGPNELHAAVLALLLVQGNADAQRAWEAEIDARPELLALIGLASQLTGATRLPCFELLLSRMAPQPLAARKALLESTRRVMRATGPLRPIDRLHWLTMRLRLGDPAFFGVRTTAADDPSLLPESDVRAIARFTAYLARIVPGDPGGAAWYAGVMAPWPPCARVPEGGPPDADGLVQALQELQALAWSHRPVLVRAWVQAALAHSRHGRLDDSAADALRLAAGLLDSPLPPELARHYSPALQEVRR